MYCRACNTKVAKTFLMCPKCGGKDFSEIPVVLTTSPPQSRVTQTLQAASPQAVVGQGNTGQNFSTRSGYGVVKYAGFWIRFGAALIDSIVSSIIATAVFIPIAILKGIELGVQGANSGQAASSFFTYSLAIYAIVAWLYSALLEGSDKRSTWGKRVVGVVVSSDSGEQLSFGQASLRFWMKYISGFFLSLPFLTAALRQDKKAVHDLIANTVVTYK